MTVWLLPALAGSSIIPMKILLRNKATGFFYAGGNEWTNETSKAYDFQTGLNALQYSRKLPSTAVEFVYLQTVATEDFILPRLSIFEQGESSPERPRARD